MNLVCQVAWIKSQQETPVGVSVGRFHRGFLREGRRTLSVMTLSHGWPQNEQKRKKEETS